MKVEIYKDKNEGGQAAFNIIKSGIENGAKVLGLATGSTPITLYNAMTSSDLDFSNMTSVNLDEYVGLPFDNDQSYHYFMKDNLFNKKPFKMSYVPDGMAADINAAAKEYDQIIEDNPIDVQILGIGRNGHIGFNEPGSAFDSLTHEVDLTQSTIDANARFFANEDDVPHKAISMGIGSILKSKKILLLAYGEDKADAIKATIEGPVTTDVPASALQNHDDVIFILDEAAASKLSNKY
ncbi:glucosamine-6-phosphate isomerase [Lapidilactobacillus dextrinicus DSM 20335]|uniref:Glucosamine-6-phosphate deaminase n=1 Tax=Lapidilactobacillus dextrinicus DSM 20335 TaxID=1423738 RepID=A0A0R2BG41_9LACO|nr:glucosamine-6-phosphate deaminase [Lapidilactobacillus dextrinicus]KRM78573.1 glucosamine-6-phosphate isomerase [Lapidilactobacillus dextrinicus DSM 20335]QFG46110.1 glucosamine-6-phosphate deaminase [Lapidilactobacillus dextrinicus]